MTKYNSFTDIQLLDLLKSGDRCAYAELYERYFNILYVHARKRLKNTQEAEDVIQEIFVDLWLNADKINIHTSLSSYLITSTRNRILNLISRKGFQEKYKISLAVGEQFEAQTDYRVRERLLQKLIFKEIEFLPPKMKRVFLMSRAEHLSYIEIAKDLNITEQSVRSHVKNALKVLRIRLGLLFFVLFFFLK
ncbi:RNA polymerase sigma factor [Pedobacter terrae]|uniref:RNA polymerase sigma factor n=1 Tax=Pedobacter terrae TaxID=405671 RepID=UPI002FF853C7